MFAANREASNTETTAFSPNTVTFTYQNFIRYPGTMAMEESTTSTHDEGECWEEDLHYLSCSEDKDRGGE